MDQQRKATIIHEIKYWKDNHLLPEHYCDFLLALYTEGTGPVTDELDDLLQPEPASSDDTLAMLMPHLFGLLMLSVVPLMLSGLFLLEFSTIIEVAFVMGAIVVVSLFYLLSRHIKILTVSYSRALYFISLVLAGLYLSGTLAIPFFYRTMVLVFMIIAGVSVGIIKKDRWLLLVSGLMIVLGIIGLFI
ncbi:hypothetical protein SAMN05421839_10136 [Halolactibacillus halophilus]|uniref:Uncharacterized protein n=1 Tax=Halolactibacillus halophilus TaxID=306540 RepID=A0A1I5KV53_9BACI|nr:hypothetical protein [Halolactibacillus halophilus]GEM00497.1 hypothetical protein HHA03_00290 [Halolactibacillus halophilus]SFO88301.1 hypothetical protein SAMN05421839_10136 [Halolactibacillus halophilus]